MKKPTSIKLMLFGLMLMLLAGLIQIGTPSGLPFVLVLIGLGMGVFGLIREE